MKSNTFILLFLFTGWVTAFAQDCETSVSEARSLYINGNFQQVIATLNNCSLETIDEQDRQEYLNLLINANLLLDNSDEADALMQAYRNEFPLNRYRKNDLSTYKRLFDSYEIRTRWRFGLHAGMNLSDFEIMQYRSISSFTEESKDYESDPGLSVTLSADYLVTKNLFVSGGLQYNRHNYRSTELIMTFQELSIAERMDMLSIPLQLGYELERGNLRYFISGGMSVHYLLGSRVDLELFGRVPSELTPLVGIPQKVVGYSVKEQRTSVSFSYQAHAGVQRKFGLTQVGVSVGYAFGLNNLVDAEVRYADNTLLRTYSYVPDDFKLNNLNFSVGVSQSIVYAKKK